MISQHFMAILQLLRRVMVSCLFRTRSTLVPQTIKASRVEAQAAEDAMLARATAASLAETSRCDLFS